MSLRARETCGTRRPIFRPPAGSLGISRRLILRRGSGELWNGSGARDRVLYKCMYVENRFSWNPPARLLPSARPASRATHDRGDGARLSAGESGGTDRRAGGSARQIRGHPVLVVDVKEPREKADEWARQSKFTFPVLLPVLDRVPKTGRDRRFW